jgi:hypothetical protein
LYNGKSNDTIRGSTWAACAIRKSFSVAGRRSDTL